ncbi:hypothetical protein FLAV_00658 [Flavobacteriales bacterium]|nr:hypothetical protein [Flavobacteriales bacterium]MCL4815373.1 hypothetical protein [Flavobacteriales bacterium]WKZ74992.1 MAG: hypothetical protein QY303_12685 [Vicingaceae bacterium]GIK69934.1 MAG: hypothetical protein BroJett020_12290 [Bacteroidota bacterium]CAG0960177.1 hypothetical protein FLAV_00658 [Flavobacteriales bacterium]
MKKINLTPALSIAFGLLTVVSCNNDDDLKLDNNTNNSLTEVDKRTLENRIKNTQKIFYSVPSPLETALMFEKAGLNYNKDLLNPIENAAKYATNFSKAINLGIYGADLTFTSIFNQTQESMFYMNCAQKLSDGLGISDVFNEKLLERMEININNRDSVSQIISETYWTVDMYLKENNRQSISALIICGGWIEGLYLGSSMLEKSTQNAELEKIIAEQKYSFESLLELLHSFKEEELVKPALPYLNELAPLFEKITLSKQEETTAETNSKTGVTTIKGGNSLHYTNADLMAIKNKISAIRNTLIKP